MHFVQVTIHEFAVGGQGRRDQFASSFPSLAAGHHSNAMAQEAIGEGFCSR